MARYRGTTAQRGLGADHQADKKRLLARHRDGDPCWRCGGPMYKWQALDRDHVVDRALGGATGPAVLAHASCNRSAGARLSNQIRPQGTTAGTAAGRDTICRTCGKRYWYSARPCEICGAHYHPHYSGQRSCSRACGVVISRRNRMAKGWRPKTQQPKPPRPVREPYAPRSSVAYYTCRYCGKLGVTRTTGTRREVCPARACQLARLAANNLRLRGGLTQEDADAQMTAVVRPPADPLWWTTAQRPRATRPPHTCPGCGEPTARYNWCDGCLCDSVNTKGRRCGNAASTDGKCGYHAAQAGQLAASRQW